MEGLSHVFIFGLLVVGSAAKTTHHFYYGTATWYGARDGDGTDGGACGYGATVYEKGYTTREAAVSDMLFMNGLGCGHCYKVMCYDPSLCKKKPVTVIVMDLSPGGRLHPHFDLSGSAIGRLAVDGQADNLRNVGVIQIVWARTPCTYGKKNITFHVMTGSNGYWLSLLVEFVNRDGDIQSMQIKEASNSYDHWHDMKHVWGASWAAQPPDYRIPLRGPFSIYLTSSSGKSLVLSDVIPKDWEPGASYTSQINF